jgi:hypothetical protein
MGVDENEEIEENEELLAEFSFIFVPYEVDPSASDFPKDMIDREEERLRQRVARLDAMDELKGIFEFYHLGDLPKGNDPAPILSLSDPENDVLDEGKLLSFLSEHPELESYLGPDPSDRIALVVTNGLLVDGNLAIIVERAIIVNSKLTSVLTARLLKDPWLALATLCYTEMLDRDFLDNKTDAKKQQFETDAQTLPPATSFVGRWSIKKTIEWITTQWGKDSIDAHQYLYGVDGAETLKSLLDNLPLPGGLDESDLRAVSYSDPPAREDLLNLTQYVQGFKRLILHQDTSTPLTIAIIGEWGKGKTSFMAFLRTALEAHHPIKPRSPSASKNKAQAQSLAPRAITVWFDAWEYDTEEKILAALLQTLAREIENHFSAYSWLNYRFEMGVERFFSSWRTAYQFMITLFAIPIILVVATVLVLTFGEEIARPTANMTGLFANAIKNSGAWLSGAAVAVIYLAWRIYRRINLPLGLDVNMLYEEKDHSARLGFLAVFREEFNRRIEQMRRMPTWTFRETDRKGFLRSIWGFFRDIGFDFLDSIVRRTEWARKPFYNKSKEDSESQDNTDKGNRIVVFIDDLDRCEPEKISDILEAIKVTLNTEGIVFVIGMDDQYVKSGIFLRYEDHIKTQRKFYSEENDRSQLPANNKTDSASVDRDSPNRRPLHKSSSGVPAKTDSHSPNWWPNRYLEKIIQISFRLPDARPNDLNRFISGVLDIEKESREEAQIRGGMRTGGKKMTKQLKQQIEERRLADQEQILSEVDSDRVGNLIFSAANNLAEDLLGNPRRIKAFVNRCRLGLYMLKLHFPDLIEGDYKEVIKYFEQWERERLKGEISEDLAIDTRQQPIYELLIEIHGCVFG